jgi:hypothetical protein
MMKLTAGLAAVSEKAERRKFFRIKLDVNVEIPTPFGILKTKGIDISLGGLAVKTTKQIKEYFKNIPKGSDIEFIITNPANEVKILKGKYYYLNDKKLVFTFEYNNLEFQSLLTDIIFGRANNWLAYEEKRPIDYLVLIKNIPKIPKLVFWKDIISEALKKIKELFNNYFLKGGKKCLKFLNF